MLGRTFLFIIFLSSLHISVICLSMVKFVYEEGVTLYSLDILSPCCDVKRI